MESRITFKQRVKRIVEKVCPYTIISTSNMTAKCPMFLTPLLDVRTSTKRYVVGRKIKNIYTIV